MSVTVVEFTPAPGSVPTSEVIDLTTAITAASYYANASKASADTIGGVEAILAGYVEAADADVVAIEALVGALGDYMPTAGGIFTGKVDFNPSGTSSAGLNIGQGNTPTTPTDGDVWQTAGGVYARVNGVTKGPFIQLNDVPASAISVLAYNAQSGGTYTLDTADIGKYVDLNGGATVTLPAASSIGVMSCVVGNSGTSPLTINRSGSDLIDSLSSFKMYPNEIRYLRCNGSTTYTSRILRGFYYEFASSGSLTVPPGYSLIGYHAVAAGGGSNTGAGAGGGGAGVKGETAPTDFAAIGAAATITVGAGVLHNDGGDTVILGLTLHGGKAGSSGVNGNGGDLGTPLSTNLLLVGGTTRGDGFCGGGAGSGGGSLYGGAGGDGGLALLAGAKGKGVDGGVSAAGANGVVRLWGIP